MRKLFISYRRRDSADATGRIYDRLLAHFGPEAVFLDVDGIPLGIDFRKHLSEAVGQCEVLVAVIGEQWLTASLEQGPLQGRRRLDDPQDYVRVEIEAALARGIPVVPVLVADATMPSEADLPVGLKDLAYRNAAEVRSGPDFGDQVGRLIRGLEQLLARKSELREGVRQASRIADQDPEMALARARRVLELVIRDVYERRYQEPPGTRPLEGLIHRLVKDGNLPDRLDALTATICQLGQLGTPTPGERVQAAEVQQSLAPLMEVLKWYFEVEQPDAVAQAPTLTPAASRPDPPLPPGPAGARLAVVPKGLRSFDAHDADFFLDLLPGSRDRNGLPESIRFWKHRIETTEELTFTVGVIYGPSGCGKSSLVKAGLLPRLAGRVVSVYVEATADDTGVRLLKGLRKRCPDLPGDLDLAGTVAAVRRGTGLGQGRKVVIILDQFEQWLHARRGEENSELPQALRQCDGEHVQCLVLVREDFWVALSRFMDALHIGLVQDQNMALVDLFDQIHARNVLSAFGRAFGRLTDEPSREQEAFLDQAVAGLAQDGRVICVRLALFAEMVKGRPWTPATLKEVGGTEGVGVAFLEETFSSATAGPRNRLHQDAARAVLKALLPGQGSDIKGNRQSHDKLLLASGYAGRPRDFEELLRILDSEVRIITPTEPEGKDEGGRMKDEKEKQTNSDSSFILPPSSFRYYQLTHDYLVPALRAWLTRKQKETRRGRAQLRLAERAASWTAKPKKRHLPTWWEWANIRLLTRTKDWTPSQRKMMRQAGRLHLVRGGVLAVVLVAATCAGLGIRGQVIEQRTADHAVALVKGLLNADIAQVPGIIREMGGHRPWVDPRLRQENREAEEGSPQKLYTSLALLPVDEGQVDYLLRRLLDAEPQEIHVIRDALYPYRQQLLDRLWAVAEKPARRQEQQLRAACALAAYDPGNPRWEQASGPVVGQLVAVNPIVVGFWIEGFRPIKEKLLEKLTAVFRDRKEERSAQRSLATNILADYAADQPDVLADLVQDADEMQFAVLFPKLEAYPERAVAAMGKTVATGLESQQTDEEKERLAKRQANAAVVMLRLHQPAKVWPLLKHSPDPRGRSYLIHRLGPLGADPRVLLRQFDEEKEESIRRALLLSLGECGFDQLSAADREPLLPRVLGLYRGDPDPGLHGAAEWLLRQWKEEKRIKEMNEQWAKDQPQRAIRLQQIQQELLEDRRNAKRQWYVNGQGQTLVVIPGPVEFVIGSPPTEAGREGGSAGKNEQQCEKRISHSFAIAARTVTVGQFLRFRKDHGYEKDYSPTDDCPVNAVSWYGAAAYCNWLSEQEGIAKDQWCYLSNEQGEYGEGMRLAPDYLHRTGYRLPSEAEWEYACRAGACTSRYYGEGEELLGRYAWYTKVSQDGGMLPGLPGRLGVRGDCLKPNEFGLFDMLGNAWEWCQDRMGPYQPGEDVEGDTYIKDRDNRLLRGGCFYTQARYVRSAYRDRSVPGYVMSNNGLRVARTFR